MNRWRLTLQSAVCVIALSATVCAQDLRAGEQAGSTIGYSSPAEALQALRLREDVTITSQNGWVIADDPVSHALWSFTPPSHPASPAVVKRQVVLDGNTVSVKMDVLCGGRQSACDKLVREFQEMNERLKRKAASLPGAVH